MSILFTHCYNKQEQAPIEKLVEEIKKIKGFKFDLFQYDQAGKRISFKVIKTEEIKEEKPVEEPKQENIQKNQNKKTSTKKSNK